MPIQKIVAIERMNLIFETLLCANAPLSAMHIHKKSNIPKTTLSRMLHSLHQFSYLSKVENKYFLGTPHHFTTPLTFLLEFQEICAPHIQELARRTGETVKISIPVKNKSKTIITHQGTKDISVTVTPNSEFPLHAGASSKILLAFGSSLFRAKFLEAKTFEKFTATTIVTAKILKKELKKVQTLGFAIDNQEYISGIEAIAYPIFIHPLLIGAISIPMLAQSGEDKKLIHAQLKTTAQNISQDIKKTQLKL